MPWNGPRVGAGRGEAGADQVALGELQVDPCPRKSGNACAELGGERHAARRRPRSPLPSGSWCWCITVVGGEDLAGPAQCRPCSTGAIAARARALCSSSDIPSRSVAFSIAVSSATPSARARPRPAAQEATPSVAIARRTAGRAFIRAKWAAQLGGRSMPMRPAQNST